MQLTRLVQADGASAFKEVSNLVLRCLIQRRATGCDSAFQQQDLDDNALGRSFDCPPEKCEERCDGLKDQPEPDAGPFGFLSPNLPRGRFGS